MHNFQKTLCGFLTECKNDALYELKDNKTYSDWRTECSGLNSLLIKLMPPDCLEVFRQYQEAANAVSGIESDYCYLHAIRSYLSIGKQFDAPSNAQWDCFVSHMIHKPANPA